MLNQMAEDYDVNPVYVLDMYRHGKVSWMLDVLLRLAVCVAAAVIVWGIKKRLSKCRFPSEMSGTKVQTRRRRHKRNSEKLNGL